MRIRSIRWGLLVWFGTLLCAVVITFGSLLAWGTRDALEQQVDSDLMHQSNALAAALEFEEQDHWGGDHRQGAHEFDDDEDLEEIQDSRVRDFEPEVFVQGNGDGDGDGWELDLPDGYLRGIAEGNGFEIRDAEGVILARGGILPPLLGGSSDAVFGFTDQGDYRLLQIAGPHGSRVRIGRSVAAEQAVLASLWWGIAIGGSLLVVLGLLGGAFISNRSLRPIAQMSSIAERLSAEDLSGRIAVDAVPRELADLGATLNDAFTRLEAAFDQQARFTADASHELRTPLAVIRTQVEATLKNERDTDEYRATLERCLTATIRMTGIVEGMLTLARLDGERDARSDGEVSLDEVVQQSVDLVKDAAHARNIELSCDLAPVRVSGDPRLLSEVISNLIENGIRYNSEPGELRVRLSRENGHALLTVADQGPGIPPDSLPQIFDRFYRVDPARSRAAGGTGLGLAITRSIVEGHRGSISVESTTGLGTTFTVRLPVNGSPSLDPER